MRNQLNTLRRLFVASIATTCLATTMAVAVPQSTISGDNDLVFQEINQLEIACQQRPGDQNLRRRLERARREAAAILAADARDALRQDLYERAAQLAGRAVDFDPQFIGLLTDVETAWSHALMDRSRSALDVGDYELAEDSILTLERIRPNSTSTRALRAELVVRAGESAANEAMLLAQTGEFDAALSVASRAMELLPGDPSVMDLTHEIQVMERRARFNALLSNADLALHNGRLNETMLMIPQLSALNVDRDRLAEFESLVESRRSAFFEWRDAGRDFLRDGRLEDAADAYRRAASVMRDDSTFRAESDHAMALITQRAHMDAASVFLDQGAIAAAMVEAEAAVDTLDTPDARALLDSIRPVHAELELNAAMDRGDAASALRILDDELLRQGDPLQKAERARLAERFVQDVKRDATLAHLDGQTPTALAILRDALTVHPDQLFRDLFNRFSGEDLLRRAVDAERRGDWQQAERLYEEAMKSGANHEVLGQRLRDNDRMAALERENEQLIRDRQELSRDLGSLADVERRTDRVIRDLQDEVARANREIDQLRRREADLLRGLRSDERHHDDLHRDLEDLKRENASLCRELEDWKRQAERWRSRYEKERRRHHGN